MPRPAARVRQLTLAWLIEAVRTGKDPVPWTLMIRAAVATGVPLAAGFAAGHITTGLLVAMGGVLAGFVDSGGPYQARFSRVGSALLGGAAGLMLGTAIHGRGWIVVAALVLVAGVSALLSAGGSTASAGGLHLLVFLTFGIGRRGILPRCSGSTPTRCCARSESYGMRDLWSFAAAGASR